MSNPRMVVYTILLGKYEDLLEQPALRESGIDAVCFTDDPDLSSTDWIVKKVEPSYPADIVRSQREIKTLVTKFLGEYEQSLYIDNTVRLKVKPEDILTEWLAQGDFVVAEHSFRDRLIDEFDEVARLNYDDAIRVHEQLWAYAIHYPDLLASKPLWTGMIARRHSIEVEEAMRIWFDHILRYSRRDQLSVRHALEASNCNFMALSHDNAESMWHTWSLGPSRRISQGKKSTLPAGPALADMIRIRTELDILQDELQKSKEMNVELEAQLRVAISQFELAEEPLLNNAKRLSSRIHALESSTSWRLTGPLRRILNSFRSMRSSRNH